MKRKKLFCQEAVTANTNTDGKNATTWIKKGNKANKIPI